MSVLIKNGRIITPELDDVGDIYIENGFISRMGTNLEVPADRTIDAGGRYVIPGGVDVHTHLDMPYSGTVSSDDFETGTRAAAFGGTTCVIDFAVQSRGMSMHEALEIWLRKAEKATIDYGFHMIVTDLPEARLGEMDEMVRKGITSFKLFMAYPGSLMVDDATISRALRRTLANGSLVCMHAENGNVIDVLVRKALAEGNTAPSFHAITRPVYSERQAVERAITLARREDAPLYIVHVSSADALAEISEARKRGQAVFAETCPQYLLLSVEDLERPNLEGAKYVFTPPPREKWHREALWKGLEENTIQVVSTDHCPVNFSEKRTLALENFARIPNGGPGIENRLQLLHHYGVNSGRLTLKRWVEILSASPAKLFGLYPRKGTLAVGSDADMVVWNPRLEHTISAQSHHMRVDYSLFEGVRVRGNAEIVLSRGEVIVDGGKWMARPCRGRFIKRNPQGRNV